jgi:hypothetical protein
MNKEQIKQEAKERAEEHNVYGIFEEDKQFVVYSGKPSALIGIQKEIDLLEKLLSKYYGNNDRLFTDELKHLKQVKAEIESM